MTSGDEQTCCFEGHRAPLAGDDLVIAWVINGCLYVALLGWLVCTYFCTVPGYDHIPAVRDSLCRAQVADADADFE
jgi:hypothetical protein